MNRNLAPVQALNRAIVLMAGSILTGDTGAPTKVSGLGYTAARTGAGVIRVTLVDSVPQIVSCIVSGEVATTSKFASNYVDITLTGGDVASKQLSFLIVVQNSTVPHV
jgi:hypothetical protein